MLQGSDPVACKNTWNFTKLGMGEGPDLFQVTGKVVPDWHPYTLLPLHVSVNENISCCLFKTKAGHSQVCSGDRGGVPVLLLGEKKASWMSVAWKVDPGCCGHQAGGRDRLCPKPTRGGGDGTGLRWG